MPSGRFFAVAIAACFQIYYLSCGVLHLRLSLYGKQSPPASISWALQIKVLQGQSILGAGPWFAAAVSFKAKMLLQISMRGLW